MMLRRGRAEDVAAFVGRAVHQAVQGQADSAHFELKEHYLVIRLRWGSRMRMAWRGERAEGLELMAYLKVACGMSAAERRVRQDGEFTVVDSRESVALPAICKPYLSGEKLVLSLSPLLREAVAPAA